MKKYIFLCCLLFCKISFSQKVVNSTGNTVTNSNYNISYSIGEISISTLSSSTNFATQGVIQPNASAELRASAPVKPAPDKQNPIISINNSFLKIKNVSDYKFYQISSTDGKIFATGTINSTLIDVHSLSSGIYFIKFYNSQNNFTIVKIIKP